MPKSSNKQIEKDEQKILKELRKNANKSVNEIAQYLGFSRQKVWRVIKNLEKNKTIWGYTTIVDEEKHGKKSYVILIKRSNKPMTKEILDKMSRKDFMKRVEKNIISPCVLCCLVSKNIIIIKKVYLYYYIIVGNDVK